MLQDDVQRGIVPKFFYGGVCFMEHISSCSRWALLAPAAAVVVGVASLIVPWQHLLSASFFKFVEVMAPVSIQVALRQLSALIPPALYLAPVVTVVVFAVMCPLCARPQTTFWESLEYTLWPPTQLFWGHTYEASGRAVATGSAVILEGVLRRLLIQRTAGRYPWAVSAVAFLSASATGSVLLWRAGGPGTELSGCLLLSPVILALSRFAVKHGAPPRIEVLLERLK